MTELWEQQWIEKVTRWDAWTAKAWQAKRAYADVFAEIGPPPPAPNGHFCNEWCGCPAVPLPPPERSFSREADERARREARETPMPPIVVVPDRPEPVLVGRDIPMPTEEEQDAARKQEDHAHPYVPYGWTRHHTIDENTFSLPCRNEHCQKTHTLLHPSYLDKRDWPPYVTQTAGVAGLVEGAEAPATVPPKSEELWGKSTFVEDMVAAAEGMEEMFVPPSLEAEAAAERAALLHQARRERIAMTVLGGLASRSMAYSIGAATPVELAFAWADAFMAEADKAAK